MEIRIKLQPLYRNELNFSEAFCTVPIIIDKTMLWGAYNVDLNMSECIWYQLPEKFKEKIRNDKVYTIKSMIITVTDITAYSVSVSNHEKLKDTITMEEIYKDFSESKKIERFLCKCDFPYSNIEVYFQNLGEIYIEFELEDLVYYEKEAKEEWRLKERERRKIREIYKSESISLEKIEEEQERFLIFIGNVYRTGKLSEEYFERFFSTYPLILRHLDAEELVLIEKNAEELGIEISDNIKYEIGYSLTNTQTEIMTEEEKEAIEEIRKKWNLKKVYED